ncbi:hypothetical protein COLO4_07268 [Corchorus olitorius]|uniref:Aminotransferase-like plant mobile domain-containing protein n=1 Tax=Corchorus olitorius TaxID=93759 RepID=A0A1R3KKD2_9ROSI|nr:hypothetical protein COLO4_07268 [Corchorus olitorius]
MLRTWGAGSPGFPPPKTKPSQIGKKQIRSKVVALPSRKKLRFSDVEPLVQVPTDWSDELINGNDSFWVNLNEYKEHDAALEQHVYKYIRTEAKGDRSPLAFDDVGVGSLDLELSSEEKETQKQLCTLLRQKGRPVRLNAWCKLFRDENAPADEFVGFLLLWYVLPWAPEDGISPTLIPLAIKLSKGTRFPLGSMYLGSLYRRLDLIHEKTRLSMGRFKLWSTVDVTFIQMCLWGRFPRCAPYPNIYDASLFSVNYRVWAWYKWQLSNTSIFEVMDKHNEFCTRPYVRPLAGFGSPIVSAAASEDTINENESEMSDSESGSYNDDEETSTKIADVEAIHDDDNRGEDHVVEVAIAEHVKTIGTDNVEEVADDDYNDIADYGSDGDSASNHIFLPVRGNLKDDGTPVTPCSEFDLSTDYGILDATSPTSAPPAATSSGENASLSTLEVFPTADSTENAALGVFPSVLSTASAVALEPNSEKELADIGVEMAELVSKEQKLQQGLEKITKRRVELQQRQKILETAQDSIRAFKEGGPLF